MPRKPLKTAINDSLFLNTPNKIDNKPSRDDLFDLSKIEYYEGSWLTFSEFYDACCLDKTVLKNHFSKYFKETRFFLDNDIRLSRKGNAKVVKNIRLRLDTSNDQR